MMFVVKRWLGPAFQQGYYPPEFRLEVQQPEIFSIVLHIRLSITALQALNSPLDVIMISRLIKHLHYDIRHMQRYPVIGEDLASTFKEKNKMFPSWTQSHGSNCALDKPSAPLYDEL